MGRRGCETSNVIGCSQCPRKNIVVSTSTPGSLEINQMVFRTCFSLFQLGPHRYWPPEELNPGSRLTFSTLVWQNIISRKATPQCRRHLSLFFDPSVELNFSFLSDVSVCIVILLEGFWASWMHRLFLSKFGKILQLSNFFFCPSLFPPYTQTDDFKGVLESSEVLVHFS